MGVSEEVLSRIRKFNKSVSGSDRELATEAGDLKSSLPVPEAFGKRIDRHAHQVQAESIIMRRFRPVLPILNDLPVLDFNEEADSAVWKDRLNKAQSVVETAIKATGRINLKGAPFAWIGTGWLVRENIIVTNRHVAEAFVSSSGNDLVFTQNDQGSIIADVDFLEEFDNSKTREFRLIKPLYVAPGSSPDIAFFEVEQKSGNNKLSEPILLSKRLETNNNVATIGYPAYDSRIPDADLMRRIYGDRYNKKRLAPGAITQVTDLYVLHNCTTLGGNSGSAVIDLDEGHALGLHFSGAFLRSNYAVRSDIVEQVLEDVLAGRLTSHEKPKIHVADNNVSNTRSGMLQDPVPGDAASINIPLTISVSLDDTDINGSTSRTTIDFADSADLEDDDFDFDTEARPEDYRDRKGYDPNFIGDDDFEVALPVVSENADQVLEFEFEGETMSELRYQNFSVVMNQQRRMCIFSAVNIDGNQYKKAKRKRWRLDPRIPEEAQIIKECYGNPPKFSRGHMTRRNDPSWGSKKEAKRGNTDSMHVTNAAPQMQAFNAPVWLELEDYALLNAIEDGMRISVLTGPYFSDDDPVRYGVKIPVSFWKVITFKHDETGLLCATGYEMNQSAAIKSEEEFVFGDFHSTHTGVSAQVSIQSIEQKSGLSFDGLSGLDPFSNQESFTGAERSVQLQSTKQIQFF